ncbi:MAG: dihydrodipicolinate synthase family protein [Planctomycetaceae bacterium]
MTGLIAATHSPFHDDASLNLNVVEVQANHLEKNGVQAAFICGTTGESHSLTTDERLQLAVRWAEVTRGTDLDVIVHVGENCLENSRTLAAHAEQHGAKAIAMLAPSYFKPGSVSTLVDCCKFVASAAPNTPFYFYDIPSMTNVSLSMVEFLRQAADDIPTLAGLKFTNPDLIVFQKCLSEFGDRFDILWGVDEMLLPALACGATGAVGSTYNFAAGIYLKLMDAYSQGDFETARKYQIQSIRLVDILVKRGYMASAKALMEHQGVSVGPPRLPNARLTTVQTSELLDELHTLDF